MSDETEAARQRRVWNDWPTAEDVARILAMTSGEQRREGYSRQHLAFLADSVGLPSVKPEDDV